MIKRMRTVQQVRKSQASTDGGEICTIKFGTQNHFTYPKLQFVKDAFDHD